VASGGELSRISLAIAVTTSELGQAGTLIFDEVDSGVGGAVAETVGRLMHSLGDSRQVLAVTHLPQVAAYADQHYRVTKRPKSNTTISSVDPLAGEEREMEMARMLGGEHLSEATMAHAREMLAMARLPAKQAATAPCVHRPPRPEAKANCSTQKRQSQRSLKSCPWRLF
jgi:DNA repair protein RecN (Recombination protein N)